MNENMSNNSLAILNAMRNGAVVRQRLQWIEDRLWWVGGLNRSDLVLRFGISPPQATNDFSLYQRLAPANIKYDSQKKLYICGDKFVPLFAKDHELWLQASNSEVADLQTIQLVGVTSLKRGIDPTLVQLIARASRNKTPLRIIYQSMKMVEPMERIISRVLKVRACLVYYQLSALYLVDAVRNNAGQPEERDFGIAVGNWKELQPLVMEMR